MVSKQCLPGDIFHVFDNNSDRELFFERPALKQQKSSVTALKKTPLNSYLL